MKLLAIETAFEPCSVALWCASEILERIEPEPRGHAEHLLPFVESLLAEAGLALADLDGIAFSRGPGSFTSLRIGIGAVQGLAFGADLPVWPVSSLRTVAQGVLEQVADHDPDPGAQPGRRGGPDTAGDGGPRRICVAMDARMGEVFAGWYEARSGLATERGEERVCAPEAALPPDPTGWIGAGSGFARCEALARAPLDRIIPGAWPRASVLAALAAGEWDAGLALPAERAQPVYLRDRVAEKPGKPKSPGAPGGG
jgi:tRNA threonylcarbamoyladenosine biosynthesis protein TsaB